MCHIGQRLVVREPATVQQLTRELLCGTSNSNTR